MKPYHEAPGLTIHNGDCREVMREMAESSVDAIVTDPPYGLEFMGRSWDSLQNGREVDPAFAHWFAGFVDGEGCFSVHKKNIAGKFETYDCQFSISLRADDEPVLSQIRRTLGIGTLAVRPRSGGGNPLARYCVSSQADCAILRDVLRMAPLRAKKARDFELWSEALDAWINHERGQGWSAVSEIRDRLMATRDYNAEGVRISPEQIWHWRWAREALRVLKPGGHLLAFGGTRTHHRLMCAIEDAGFEIRDTVMWVYSSGFPKSLDVGKAIDKAAGVERVVVGQYESPEGTSGGSDGSGVRVGAIGIGGLNPITAPATDAAKQWDGFGTALKPAHEPIVLARKPLDGTVAENVQKHGTGGLNIDGCRVETDGPRPWLEHTGRTGKVYGAGLEGSKAVEPTTKGRWPANLIHDGSDEVLGLFPETTSGALSAETLRAAQDHPGSVCYGTYGGKISQRDVAANSGSAARFFYTAKASRSERGEGNDHPTVKPLALMRYLCRLITPSGGVVLDPFMGSGSTLVAAREEWFRAIGIDTDERYCEIAAQRLSQGVLDFGGFEQ